MRNCWSSWHRGVIHEGDPCYASFRKEMLGMDQEGCASPLASVDAPCQHRT